MNAAEERFIKKYQPYINEAVDNHIKEIRYDRRGKQIGKESYNYICNRLKKYANAYLPSLIDHLDTYGNTIMNYRNYDALNNAGMVKYFIKDLSRLHKVKYYIRETDNTTLKFVGVKYKKNPDSRLYVIERN